MANTIIARILSVGQAVNVSKTGNAYMKRELVLNASRFDPYTGEERPNYVAMSFTQRNCEKLDAFRIGDLVEVSFILQGREYVKDGQKRYITDIVGYDIKAHSRGGHEQPSTAAPPPSAPLAQPSVGAQAAEAPAAQQAQQEGAKDDLPF